MTKRCCECGVEKPLAKFYKHPAHLDGLMPHCRWCHNGGQDLIRRGEEFRSEPQLGDPSESQIAIECKRFQSRWSTAKRQSRQKGKVFA